MSTSFIDLVHQNARMDLDNWYPGVTPPENHTWSYVLGEVVAMLRPISDTDVQICALAVNPSLRGGGRGTTLVRNLQTKWNTIWANVLLRDGEFRRLKRFWERLGFKAVGLTPDCDAFIFRWGKIDVE